MSQNKFRWKSLFENVQLKSFHELHGRALSTLSSQNECENESDIEWAAECALIPFHFIYDLLLFTQQITN